MFHNDQFKNTINALRENRQSLLLFTKDKLMRDDEYDEYRYDDENVEGEKRRLYYSFGVLFEAIRGNKGVEEVFFEHRFVKEWVPTDLLGALFESIETLPNLTKLSVSSNNKEAMIEDNYIPTPITLSFKPFTKILLNSQKRSSCSGEPTISRLHLEDCNLSENNESDFRGFYDALRNCHGIEVLSLCNVIIPFREIKGFTKALSMTPQLEVNLQQNHEHDPLFNVAVECVELNSPSVEKIRIENIDEADIVSFPYASMVAIKSALVKNSNLKCLEFHEMDIEDDAGTALAETLKLNSCPIRELSVCHSTISMGSICAIARALTKNQTIEALKLDGNGLIFDDSGIVLAKALRENSTLKVLSLCNSEIGNRTCQELAESLRHNSTLKELRLFGCKYISEDGFAAFDDVLKENIFLERVDLSNPNKSRKLEFYLWLNKDCHRANFLRNNNVTRDKYVNNMIQSKYEKRMGRVSEKRGVQMVVDKEKQKCYDLSAGYYWIRSKPCLCTTGGRFFTCLEKRKRNKAIKAKNNKGESRSAPEKKKRNTEAKNRFANRREPRKRKCKR